MELLVAEQIAQKRFTAEEYLTLEENAEVRHEFVNGLLIEMAGETFEANEITLNLAEILRKFLRSKGYRLFTHEIRTIVRENNIYRYPDVVIAEASALEGKNMLKKPAMIIEVLSDSTSKVDRGAKLKEYCALPSLQYYCLVAQDEVSVELFHRNEHGWEYDFYLNLSDSLPLPFFGTNIALKDIYEGITFSE